ncbi:glycosyltransferase [Photobacterium frigidiphilum]|uniref:Glycosyltransferase n=1 Tax=Photobacterium frigidiphilum TaxID=264736 RepID=A0A2T3JDE2_9GAMM|nr:glycosyltransferase family 2 protein [Photobacterium frigidiphilum]PSU46883.1 glycosyltransferase [Photobacterium frigidiphilum]
MSTITLLSQHRDKQNKGKEKSPLLSIIIPMYNEELVIEECHKRVCAVLDGLNEHCEIIYVDDGSSDSSVKLASSFSSEYHQIVTICLSRNFGKEAAMSAGLQAAKGQAVILIDADLQDPPELIPAMVNEWKQGFDVVDMQRHKRHGESWFKRITAAAFYKLINSMSDIPIPQNVGDFRLIDRRVVDEINKLPERTRFMKGLFAWPGFRRTTLQFDRDARQAGETKWNYTKLVHLAFEGITSFSTRPLRLATAAGLFTSLAAIIMAAVVFTKTIIWGDPVAGYPSTIMIVLLLGGVQLLSIGLMGEYVGRLFIEAKQRPLFVVMDQTIKNATANVTMNTNHAETNNEIQTFKMKPIDENAHAMSVPREYVFPKGQLSTTSEEIKA